MSLLPAPSSPVSLHCPTEDHAQASICLCPLCPRYFILCTVRFRPTWIVSSYTAVCPSFEFSLLCVPHPPPAELSSKLGSASALCPPSLLALPNAEGQRQRRQGQHIPALTVHHWERPSCLSNVWTNALQTIWDPASRLLGALAPCCPQGLCLPFPRSLQDPCLGGSQLCREAPAVWPGQLCNLL